MLSSAYAFNFNQSQILLFGKELKVKVEASFLNHYHTIPKLLMTLKKKALKTMWEKEKMLLICRLQILSIWSPPKFCCLIKG